jgi:hypothetical protein
MRRGAQVLTGLEPHLRLEPSHSGSQLAALEECVSDGCTCPETAEWFYFKDYCFYNLKIESKYPWMRNASIYSILVTMAFLLFTPFLWCGVLRDEK